MTVLAPQFQDENAPAPKWLLFLMNLVHYGLAHAAAAGGPYIYNGLGCPEHVNTTDKT